MNTIQLMRGLEKKGWNLTYVESPIPLNLTNASKEDFERSKSLLCKLISPSGTITSFSVSLVDGPYESIFKYVFHNVSSPLYGSIEDFQ